MIKKLYKDFSGLLIIFALFLAWCLMTVSYSNGLFLVLSFAFNMAGLFFYYNNSDIIIKQSRGLNILLILMLADIIPGGIRTAFSKKETEKNFLIEIAGKKADRAELTLSLMALIWLIVLIIIIVKNKESYKGLLSEFKDIISKHKGLMILLLLVAVLAYDPDWKQYKWDSLLYCQAASRLDITLFSEMGVYGHISQGFSLLVKLLEYAFFDIRIALFVGNVLLLIVGTVYVYALIKKLLPNKQEAFYLAATAIYAFSPYYLGMVNYYSLDYYLMCLIPALAYYAYMRKWMQLTIVAILFCFTKETAILIYGFFCIGIVIADLIEDYKSAEEKRLAAIILNLFKRVHYYYMAVAGLLWIVTYKLLGPWVGGDHSVGVNGSYILNKLKVLYVLNFNWLFTLIVIIGLTICIRRRLLTGDDYRLIIPLLSCQLIFSLFNLVFVTANHPRYTDSTPYVLYILAIIMVSRLISAKKERLTLACTCLLAALMLIQCFITIDPVSILLFDNYKVGRVSMLAASPTMGDSAVYNKQMLWAERPLSGAIADGLNKDSKLILTAFKGTANICDGMALAPTVTYTSNSESQYWNDSLGRREPFATDANREIEISHITENGSLSELAEKGQTVSLIYSALDDMGAIENLKNQLSDTDREEYSYRGFVYYRLTGKLK